MEAEDSALAIQLPTWNHYTWSSWSSRKPTVMKLTNFTDGFKKPLILEMKQRPRWRSRITDSHSVKDGLGCACSAPRGKHVT